MNRRKKGRAEKVVLSSQQYSVHKRLHHALELGFRYSNDKQKEWYSHDAEVQKMALRSISAFLDGISAEILQLPVVKDIVSDIFRALGGILQLKNEAVLDMASEVAKKLVSVLPNSMMQPHLVTLIHPSITLLSSHQPQVATAFAQILRQVISNLSSKMEKNIWEILKETEGVAQVISLMLKYIDGMMPNEYILELASLLSVIGHRWPSSRYPMWSNDELMEGLRTLCVKSETSVRVAVFQLFSSLALCDYGAKKLLNDGDVVINIVVECMGISYPDVIRIQSFKLAQILVANEQGFSTLMKLHCERLVQSIVVGMTAWKPNPEKVTGDKMLVSVESCHLARIVRWPGKHHSIFWKLGIDNIIFDLTFKFQSSYTPCQSLSTQDTIAYLQENVDAQYLLGSRPYIFEILGWLAAYCDKDYVSGSQRIIHLNLLITTTCLLFVELIDRKHRLSLVDPHKTPSCMAAAQATLLMMYSPCKHIAFQTRLVLSELLKHDGREHVKYILHSINSLSTDFTIMSDKSQLVIQLMALACYSGMPEFYEAFVQGGGVKNLMLFANFWLNDGAQLVGIVHGYHSNDTDCNERSCCRVKNSNWEGEETLLLWALWSLSEFVNHCHSSIVQLDVFYQQPADSRQNLIEIVQKIAISANSSGVRWYAAYLLSFFGTYGFTHGLRRIHETAFGEEELADIKMLLASGECLNVHGVILSILCPSLLPPLTLPSKENSCYHSSAERVVDASLGEKKEVLLSAKVDYEALKKLLSYIYTGQLQADKDLVRKLKVLARYCNLYALLCLLDHRRPKWGDPTPNADLSSALGPCGLEFSDIVLQAKSTGREKWVCNWCSSALPHLHAHKIILRSRCEYTKALLGSGMQESQSQTLQVPVSFEALEKLALWIYSGKLPYPPSGCLWDHMDVAVKVHELLPYIELCWLCEFWMLDEVHEECLQIVISSLDSLADLSVKILQLSVSFSQWKLVEVAANHTAPYYQQLRESGALDVLDEELIDLIRAASVHLSQELSLEL